MTSRKRLRELFSYDAASGRLVRKVCVRDQKPITFGESSQGYLVRWVDGVCYVEHRLVWLYHFGKWPREIDHINTIKTDNRIENLRDCGRTQNNGNHRRRVNNTSGFRGVSWHVRAGKWLAQINYGKTHYHLGLFLAKTEAAEAYNTAARELFGPFARLNPVP